MDVSASITVYFDHPFWVCIYERIEDGRLSACRIVFGAEPKEYEVYEHLLGSWGQLKFSTPLAISQKCDPRNPKRRQREAAKFVSGGTGPGTKSQQALSKQNEQNELAKKNRHKLLADEEKRARFALRQEKKKQKRKGH